MSFKASHCPCCGVSLGIEHERALIVSLGDDDVAHSCGSIVKCDDLCVIVKDIDCPEGLPDEYVLQPSEMHCPQCNQMMLQHKRYSFAYCCTPCNIMVSVETQPYVIDEEESE